MSTLLILLLSYTIILLFVCDRQDPRNPSNRQKLMRYNSKMEQEHGPEWRKIMEDEDEEEGAAEKV